MREVALKVLREPDPLRVLRLCREAQLQAKVTHPNVCPIFDVGMLPGSAFIAMPLLLGRTLEAAAGALDLETRIRLIQEAAEGLQAAHAQGLVHRDVKPANILLEPGANGQVRAVVLDFGLATERDDPGLVFGGEGTPAYMSPEQARGEEVGPAADTYSLGVILAELIQGSPTWAGLRADLQAIAEKATQARPEDRYPTAGEMALDLGRWRARRPVAAGNPGRFKRFALLVRRHTWSVALGLAAGIGVAALTLAFRAHTQGVRRFELKSRALLARVQDLEATLRIQRMLPPHGIRAEVDQGWEVVRTVDREAMGLEGSDQGFGAYVRGRVRLALGDLEGASALLQEAEVRGYQDADFRFTHGRAQAMAYQAGVVDLDRLPKGPARDARTQELENLKGRALADLREGQASRLAPLTLQEGLVALCEGRFEDALARARAAAAADPWLYESASLEGEILLLRGAASPDRLRGWEDLLEAGQAFAKATALAPSDPRLRALEARRCSQALRVAWEIGKPPAPFLAAQMKALDAWRILEGGEPAIEAFHAQALADEAFWTYLKGGDPLRGAKEGRDRAAAILKQHPDHPEASFALASACHVLAVHYLHGGAGAPAFEVADQGLNPLRNFIRQRPRNLNGWDLLSRLHFLRGRAAFALQPETGYQSAVEAAEKDMAAFPVQPDTEPTRESYLVRLRLPWADSVQELGGDPRPILRESLVGLTRVVASRPESAHLRSQLASVHLVLGQASVIPAREAEEFLRLAGTHYQEAWKRNPLLDHAWGRMLAAGLLAERALARGLDPSVELADMDAAVADMIRLVPMHWSGLQGQAWRRYLEARRPGQPQGAVVVLLVQAEREVTKALGANPEPLDLHLLRIRIRRRLIEVGAPEAALRRRQVMEELRTQLKRTPRALQVRAEARALGITIR